MVNLNQELRIALEESVKLQSHYAKLLNMYDGGQRISFATADEWITRLQETGTLDKTPADIAKTFETNIQRVILGR